MSDIVLREEQIVFRCLSMVSVGLSSFVATTSCNGFIVRPTATAGLLLSIETYAKASRTATVRSWSATSGPLVNGPLRGMERRDDASSEQVSLWNKTVVRVTTASGSYLSVKKD